MEARYRIRSFWVYLKEWTGLTIHRVEVEEGFLILLRDRVLRQLDGRHRSRLQVKSAFVRRHWRFLRGSNDEHEMRCYLRQNGGQRG